MKAGFSNSKSMDQCNVGVTNPGHSRVVAVIQYLEVAVSVGSTYLLYKSNQIPWITITIAGLNESCFSKNELKETFIHPYWIP